MKRTRSVLLTAVPALVVALGACGSDDPSGSSAATSAATSAGTGTGTGTGTSTATSPGTSPGTSSPAPGSSAVPVSDEPFGEGCSAVPAEGPGSFAGMGADPVATAAGNTPSLSSLVTAVRVASLVDTLNTTPDITVLAPADEAFAAVPADAVGALLADTPELTAVLTHHVIPGRLSPDELAGTHTTLNNDQVTIEGSGEDFTIAADATVLGQTEASVVCGNVQTANATVYIIDQVLAPTA